MKIVGFLARSSALFSDEKHVVQLPSTAAHDRDEVAIVLPSTSVWYDFPGLLTCH
jgi:hypothetical protein